MDSSSFVCRQNDSPHMIAFASLGVDKGKEINTMLNLFYIACPRT
jgi:hypothetical protein